MATDGRRQWRDTLYALGQVQIWVNAFYRRYGRASDYLLKYSRKKHKDVYDLAQKSQNGWELWKKLVKELEKIYKMYSPEMAKLFCHIFDGDMERTIQAFSKNIISDLRTIEFTYKDEFEYLTRWWSGVI